jgi:hypothetical protein
VELTLNVRACFVEHRCRWILKIVFLAGNFFRFPLVEARVNAKEGGGIFPSPATLGPRSTKIAGVKN